MSRSWRTALGPWVGRALFGVVAVVAGWWLLNSPLLAFGDVEVTGYDGTDLPQLEAAIREAAHDGNLLTLPREEVAGAAARFPAVGDVAISREWPRSLRVRVIPARPAAAIVSRKGPSVVVSSRGRVIGPAPKRHQLPRLLASGVPPKPGARLPKKLEEAFAFATELPPEIAGRVRALHQVNGRRIEGRLTGLGDLIVGPPGRPKARAVALTAVLNDLSEGENSEQDAALYVDVSVPERPAVGFPVAAGVDSPSS
jgi:cell division protein FtsQ